MKGIYLEKNNTVAYFIDSYKEDDFVVINGAASIAESAFAHSNLEKILFKSCSPNIGEKAFEGCELLTAVIFSEQGKDETSSLKNIELASVDGDYVIQTNAFKDCGKLTTLVLPKLTGYFTTLTIKEDAFCGCESLRTMVALCDEIQVSDNSFAKLGERLTFVYKSGCCVVKSGIDEKISMEEFAKNNGYRSVCIG